VHMSRTPQILFRRCCGAAVARVIQPCACKLVRPFVAVIAAVAAIPDTQPSTTFCELSEEATARLDFGDLLDLSGLHAQLVRQVGELVLLPRQHRHLHLCRRKLLLQRRARPPGQCARAGTRASSCSHHFLAKAGSGTNGLKAGGAAIFLVGWPGTRLLILPTLLPVCSKLDPMVELELTALGTFANWRISSSLSIALDRISMSMSPEGTPAEIPGMNIQVAMAMLAAKRGSGMSW